MIQFCFGSKKIVKETFVGQWMNKRTFNNYKIPIHCHEISVKELYWEYEFLRTFCKAGNILLTSKMMNGEQAF